MLPEVLPEIAKSVTKDKTLITIAAGKSTGWYEERLAKGVPVVRVMPNINAKVKASVTAICGGKGATKDDIRIADGITRPLQLLHHAFQQLHAGNIFIGRVAVREQNADVPQRRSAKKRVHQRMDKHIRV